MGQPKTQGALVPPPPAPPTGSVAAATPDPERDPSHDPAGGRSRDSSHVVFVTTRSVLQAHSLGQPTGFLNDVVAELRRFVWPAAGGVWASTLVTVGLLALFTLFIWGLNTVAGSLSSAIGIR